MSSAPHAFPYFHTPISEMRFYLPRVLLFAFIWAALKGNFTPLNLVAGVVFGLVILLFVRQLHEDAVLEDVATSGGLLESLKRAFWMGELLLYFFWALAKSSAEVAQTVLRPNMGLNPGIVSIPLDCTTDLEITTLANLISLTPGTLSLEVSPDRDKLYIHAMFVGTEEMPMRTEIKQTLERRVIRTLGPYGDEEKMQAETAESDGGPAGARR